MFVNLLLDGRENVKKEQARIAAKIKEEYETHISWTVHRVVHKNVLLIGRTRTGKSTIKSVLVNPCRVPENPSLYSQTKNADFSSYVINGCMSDVEEMHQKQEKPDARCDREHIPQKQFAEAHVDELDETQGTTVLNIIDAPGLFERGSNELDLADNQRILETIETCINREITKFHVVCFCASFESGINEQDIESLQLLIKFLGEAIAQNSCLIVTRCESKDDAQRDRLRMEITNDVNFRKIAPHFKKGIYFSGSLNFDNWNQAQEQTLYRQFKTICEYRQELLELFTSDIKPFAMQECDFSNVKHVIEERRRLHKEIESLKAKGEENKQLIMELRNIQKIPCIIS